MDEPEEYFVPPSVHGIVWTERELAAFRRVREAQAADPNYQRPNESRNGLLRVCRAVAKARTPEERRAIRREQKKRLLAKKARLRGI